MIERTVLPGVGLRHILTTAQSRRIGIISHRTGRQDLVIYDRADPDHADLIVLTPAEAGSLAKLLGTARAVERLSEQYRQIQGLVSISATITPEGKYAGKSLAETQARSRTGASIVAVIRDHDVIVSPRPDFVFHTGDVVVIVGTAAGTSAVASILCDG